MGIDPELEPFIRGLRAAWPTPPHRDMTVAAWRAKAEALSAAVRPPRPAGLTVTDLVADPDDRRVPLRLYRPAGEALGCLLYMHGGGWVIGSVDTHDDITAAIAARSGCAVASVDYARAPERPFPAAYDDCAAALLWLRREAPGLGLDPARIGAGGDSAGGNLGAALALTGRDAVAAQVLLYPCLDTDFATASYHSEADAPFLTGEQMRWFWAQYLPAEAADDPRAVPLRATDLAGTAPAYVAVAEHDPLRDDGLRYAARLAAAGVPVMLRPGHGLIHGHMRTRAVSAAAAAEFDALCDWLATTLGGPATPTTDTPA